ncbi:MAG: hypothetical protein R3E12_00485 [Candidatus Eisenbacteria bacterium]
MTTRQLDSILGGPQPAFSRGFIPRCNAQGPHLAPHRHTYAQREQVGTRAHIGQRYGYNWGPFHLQGRISGQQYLGSFAKPIKLQSDQYLYAAAPTTTCTTSGRTPGTVASTVRPRLGRPVWLLGPGIRPTPSRPSPASATASPESAAPVPVSVSRSRTC